MSKLVLQNVSRAGVITEYKVEVKRKFVNKCREWCMFNLKKSWNYETLDKKVTMFYFVDKNEMGQFEQMYQSI